MNNKTQREKNQNIQVFVRVRPLSSSEKSNKSHNVVELPTTRELVIKERPHERFTRTFAFDHVFGPNSRQIDVYMSVVHPMISEVIAGYNCTVFAYGQTGTGKTFTMEGEKSSDAAIAWDHDPLSGIIPRTLSNLFDELRMQQVEFTVRVSFLELYNEELIDLLSRADDASKLRLFEDSTKKGSVIVQGLEEVMVHNKNEVYSIMEKGSIKRQTASTLMNAHSSRSHTIFSITVHIKENNLEGEELLKTGKLNLVDLAGSENIGRSGAMNARAREAGNINQSLLTLGRVITALVERAPHVPYRESKLTRLLQDSLGGRTKTSIIATISPAANNLEETLSTLDYAHRAKNITNRPEINQKMTKKTLIKEYTSEIERLRKDLAAAREKSGVYLDYDNYTQMIAQIEQQEQEISRLLSQLKGQKEELDKKEEICDQLHMSLEDCNSKLASTYHKLEDTKQELTNTSEKLHNTINLCNEKTHLIEKHETTEQTLSTQAQSLLSVADIATADTDKLHDKLERKRSVETTNEDIARNFHASFVQNVANMEDSVNRFTQDLVKFCSGLQTNLGERLEKRSFELASLSNEMSSFVDSRTQLIQDLEKMFSNQVYNGQQWIQQYLTTVRSTSDSEVNNLHKFLTDLFLAPVRSLSRQLQLVEADTKAMGRTVVEQIQQDLDMVKDFDASLKTSLSQLRESVLSQFLLQQQALESSESSIHSMDEMTQSYKETLAAQAQQLKSLADSILNAHGAFENQYNENKSQLRNGVTVAREKCDHLCQLTTTVIDQQLNRRSEQLNTYETQAEELIDSVSNSRQNVEQLLVGASRFEDELENNVRMVVANGEKAWRNHYSVTEQELRKYSENLNVELQRELKVTQDLMSGLRESAESHEAILEQQRIDFGTFVRERQNDLDSQCSYVNHWNQVIVSELQQRNQDLDKFLVEDLRKDVPTGGTPQRREFQYPRELAATSPHERILARFRAVNDPPAPLNKLPEESPKDDAASISSSISSLNNEGSVIDEDSSKDTRGAKSRSITDISNTDPSESVLNISLQSEPPSSRRTDNKENTRSPSMKKYKSEELNGKMGPSRAASKKALKTKN